MRNLPEKLTEFGIGYYRRVTDFSGNVEVHGPYSRRSWAIPTGETPLVGVTAYAEFHIRKPKGAIPPKLS